MIINGIVLWLVLEKNFYWRSFNPVPLNDEGVGTVHKLNAFEEYREVE